MNLDDVGPWDWSRVDAIIASLRERAQQQQEQAMAEDEGCVTREDRRRGPVTVVLRAHGLSHQMTLHRAPARIAIQSGTRVGFYEVWGLDDQNRLVYVLVAKGQPSAGRQEAS